MNVARTIKKEEIATAILSILDKHDLNGKNVAIIGRNGSHLADEVLHRGATVFLATSNTDVATLQGFILDAHWVLVFANNGDLSHILTPSMTKRAVNILSVSNILFDVTQYHNDFNVGYVPEQTIIEMIMEGNYE